MIDYYFTYYSNFINVNEDYQMKIVNDRGNWLRKKSKLYYLCFFNPKLRT